MRKRLETLERLGLVDRERHPELGEMTEGEFAASLAIILSAMLLVLALFILAGVQ